MQTKAYIQLIGVFFFIACFSELLYSQNEPSFKTDTAKIANLFFDGQKVIKPLNLTLIDPSQSNSILNFEPNQFLIGFKPNAQNYFDPFNTRKKPINFMSSPKKVDSDILVKKHFNGKDMSNVKLTSDYSLGTLQSTSKSIRIEVRDHSLVDGDRIKIYVNEHLINSNIMLSGLSRIINVNLIKGYNRIDIEAINEGYSGPNTAELRVFDENGTLISSQEWNILTGQRATLGVIRN
ncbi:MAG: hypothetical protein QNK20_00140 [Aureibaculum sp.]|nr:hypothetical protein [Aureibaculum sp.]